MPSYGKKSTTAFNTLTTNLQRLFNYVIKVYDNSLIQGHRPVAEQLEYYNSKRSKVKFGKHNTTPSKAVDAAPHIPGRGIPWPQTPEDWNNKEQRNQYIKDVSQFYHFAGFVEGVATQHSIDIRWGGDWDKDHDLSDNTFDDLVHYEEI